MVRRLGLLLLVALAAGSAAAWGDGQPPAPLRIFLRGGPKTHGPAGNGLHDHEVWVKTWQPVRPGRNGAPPAPSTGRLIPQIWVYEHQLAGGQPYRAYVNLLGHHFSTFSSPHVRGVMLRGIAWAGRRDADLLATREEIEALRD